MDKKNTKPVYYIFPLLLMLFSTVGGWSGSLRVAPGCLQFQSAGHILGFTATGIQVANGPQSLAVEFLDASNVQPQAGTDEPGSMERVAYPDLWPGILLEYDAPAGTVLRSTYTVQPGADPRSIRLRYNTPVALNADGSLRIALGTGSMMETAPIAWQEMDGGRVPVEVRFFLPAVRDSHLGGQTVSFFVGAYDPHHPLVIDPSLVWNTFMGGDGNDFSRGIAMDGNGDIYVTGSNCVSGDCTVPPDYLGNDDAFVRKLDGDTGELIWNTYLGGDGLDNGMGITLDESGNVYVSGYSTATWGSPIRAYGGGDTDGFAAKLDGATGDLVWNTFLGGSGADRGWGIDADESGNIFVAGNSPMAWSCLPTACTVRAFSGSDDAFIVRLNGTSGQLVWNTFLGGGSGDVGYDVTVDGSGYVYVAGYSESSWGSPSHAYTAGADGFAAKINTSGVLSWNSFIGGNGADIGYGIAADVMGNIYVVGKSDQTWGSPLNEYHGNGDSFVAGLDGSTGTLAWNTFLGGDGYDYGYGVAADEVGNVYVAGGSDATWGNPLRVYSSNLDGFAAKLDASGILRAVSFLGGDGNDRAYGVAVGGVETDLYISGYSDADWGAPKQAYTALSDAFAAKVDLTIPQIASINRNDPNPTLPGNLSFTVNFSVPVNNVDTSDFQVVTTGTLSGASITGLSGSADTYIVNVSSGTGNGTLRLNVPATSDITSLMGVPLFGLPFTGGQVYEIVKKAIFRSQGVNDGWILETGEKTNKGGTLDKTASTLRLGDDASKKQYRVILSFKTGPALPDNAIIAKVTLRFKKQGIVGGKNPVGLFKGFMVDVKKGTFGTAALVASDFQAKANKSYGPFVVALKSGWYTISLTEGTYINKLSTSGGLTQIRVRFKLDDNNNSTANYLSLYSGNAAKASWPKLIVEYYTP